VSMASVIIFKTGNSGNFNIASLCQVFHTPYVKPELGKGISVNFIPIYQVGNEAAQVIFFALLTILVKKGKYSWWEDIAGGGDEA